MRFLHLADLHFGKSIYGTSLVESGDQGAWVDRLIERTDSVKPDAVVIAGDVYDRAAPAAEAVALLSRMLTALTERRIPVLMTAGNHDSARRLAFVRELLAKQGLHVSAPLAAPGALTHVTLQDAHGPVTFWLMPYVFPALVGEALGGEELRSYDAAVRRLLEAQEIDFTGRNVLVAHQNVTANGQESPRGGSETTVGGVGQVEFTAFDGFDYAALGHIHAGYAVGRPEVRYAGSPLCYHFDETRQPRKGPVLVELGPKGEPVRTEVLEIPPLHPMRALRGSWEELRDQALARSERGEYISLTLTDRRVTPEISEFFRGLYRERDSVLMELVSVWRADEGEAALTADGLREKGLAELFADFYTQRSAGAEPDPEELALLRLAEELAQRAELRLPPEDAQINAILKEAAG